MAERKRVAHAEKIGQVARETGLSIDTIRFYEKQGLLARAGRTEGGFRVFGPEQIRTLKFVRKVQELGFSLAEIRELLILRREHVPACSHVRALLEHKLASVEEKMTALRVLQRSLKDAVRKCRRAATTDEAAHGDCCPVLDEINRASAREQAGGEPK